MFTGIVEELGKIKALNINGNSGRISIQAHKVLENTKIGDSIAVNGICLTVTSMSNEGFSADVMSETMRRSSLKNIKSGDYVNLERAMACDGRFGGHIVSGHIDGTGSIVAFQKDENAIWVSISAPASILNLIVEKGSICIDGISLTVAYVDEKIFKVSVIPHTAKETNLIQKKVGDDVNLENDIVGKYIQKFMSIPSVNQNGNSSLTYDLLKELDY